MKRTQTTCLHQAVVAGLVSGIVAVGGATPLCAQPAAPTVGVTSTAGATRAGSPRPPLATALLTVPAPARVQDTTTPPPGGAMAELIKPIPRDFVRLFTWRNAVITGIGGAGAFAAASIDDDVADSDFGQDPHPFYEPGQYVGDVIVNMASGLTLYAIGRHSGRAKLRAIGSGIFRVQIVSQSLVQVIKPAVGRERPDGSNFHSFPSGHSATSFATATVLHEELGWKAGLPAYGIAVWTAASRIHQKRHYVSDVVFGATLGIIAGRAVTVGRDDLRFAVSPSVTSRGWRVDFVRVR